MIPYSRPKLSARVNCLKTTPFTAAHTYIAHICQYPPPGRKPATKYTLINHSTGKTKNDRKLINQLE